MAHPDADPYLNAAFLFVGVICQKCDQAIRDNETPTPITPCYPHEGWDSALALALRVEGWIIYPESGALFELMTICPACAHHVRKELLTSAP